MPPRGDWEWQARRYIGSLSYSQIARALSWVPLLLTPPALGAGVIAVQAYLNRRWPLSDYDRKILYICAINIALSLALLTSLGPVYLDGVKRALSGLYWLVPDLGASTTPAPIDV